jgi:penicillin-binding protein 1A
MTLFRAVTAHGTGAAVAQMNHPLGGKTGTTSDYTDAWFLGFSPSVTCGVWVGFDSRQSLGEKETGARAALPIWMQIMKAAISGKDDEQFPGDGEDSTIQKASLVPPPRSPGQLTSPAADRAQGATPTASTKPGMAQSSSSASLVRSAVAPDSKATQPRAVPSVVKPALTPSPHLTLQQPVPSRTPGH